MLNRRDENDKSVLKPAQSTSPLNTTGQFTPGVRPAIQPAPSVREHVPSTHATDSTARAPSQDKDVPPSGPPAIGPDMPGSRLCVGPKIKLKGVEISDCDVLVVEGEVEATVNSKAMQIAQPGVLRGHVAIEIAEVYGDFSGELTARAKLIIHGTGRVSGTIRYGKLVVEEGGMLSGDIQRLDTNAEAQPARPLAAAETKAPERETRPLLSPQPTR